MAGVSLLVQAEVRQVSRGFGIRITSIPLATTLMVTSNPPDENPSPLPGGGGTGSSGVGFGAIALIGALLALFGLAGPALVGRDSEQAKQPTTIQQSVDR